MSKSNRKHGLVSDLATTATTSDVAVHTASASIEAMAPSLTPEGQVIDKSTPMTLDRALADFESEESLSPDQRKFVEKAIGEIVPLRAQMVENMLAIGTKLKALRDKLTSSQWRNFLSNVLPKIGISSTTAKRWLQSAIETERLIPNADFRRQVMAIGDGRAIVIEETVETSDGKERVTKLSPYFATAMASNPLPANASPSVVEETARKVINVANHLRAAAQVAKRDASGGTRMVRGYNATVGVFLNNPKADAAKVMKELLKSFARQFGRDDTIVLSNELRQIAESGQYTPAIGTSETRTDAKNDEKAIATIAPPSQPAKVQAPAIAVA